MLQVRDIGLHLQGDHAHEHHHHEEAAASSASADSKQGYGRDVPEPALPVTLTEPAAAKQSGYPRENPANPLKIDAQPANEVEVRVQPDQSNNNNMMMMGGEIPGTAGVDYPIYDTVPETSFKCEDQATGGYYADEEARCQVSAFALYGSWPEAALWQSFASESPLVQFISQINPRSFNMQIRLFRVGIFTDIRLI